MIIQYLILHFAITAWPFLNFLGSHTNHKEISFLSFSLIFLVFWGIGLAGCELIKKIIKVSRENILIPYTFFVILFFSYLPFKTLLDTFHVTRIFYIFLFMSVGIIWGGYKLSKFQIFQKVVQIFIVVIFSASFLENILLWFNEESVSSLIKLKNDVSYEFKKNRNVYYLLVDMYPRADVLKSNLNYDNSDFVNFFKNKGFVVAEKSFSNFSFTNFSLTSTLEMNYPKNKDVIRSDILSPNKPVLSIFRENNYKFIIVPPPQDTLQARNSADLIISKKFSMILSDTFIQFFEKSLLCIFTPLLDHFTYFGENEIKKIFHSDIKDKKFVFIHFMHFHDLVYGKNCKINKSLWRNKRISSAIPENLPCINTFVMDTINEIMAHDPDSIILVQGDHGAYYWRENRNSPASHDEFLRQHANFSALYIPDLDKNTPIAKYLADSPTPVNNFRVIFSYLSEKPADLLPDLAYGVVDSGENGHSYSFQDITHLKDPH